MGIEKSFLEAEYHCHDGYKLMRKSKRKAFIKNKNLLCRNRRWFGQRPVCKEIKTKLKHSTTSIAMMQQCDIHEAKKCEQLCAKRENQAEATCYCHQGFRLSGGARCFGKFKIAKKKNFADDTKITKNICFRSVSIADINECEEDSGACGNGKCINSIGSYKCQCHKGFRLDNDGRCVGESMQKFSS